MTCIHKNIKILNKYLSNNFEFKLYRYFYSSHSHTSIGVFEYFFKLYYYYKYYII